MRHDEYTPAELRRLLSSLRVLHQIAYPATPGSFIAIATVHNEYTPEPDEARSEWRAYLGRILKDLDRTSTQIYVQIFRKGRAPKADPPGPKPAASKPARSSAPCAICGTQPLRAEARYCDMCGHEQPTQKSTIRTGP